MAGMQSPTPSAQPKDCGYAIANTLCPAEGLRALTLVSHNDLLAYTFHHTLQWRGIRLQGESEPRQPRDSQQGTR